MLIKKTYRSDISENEVTDEKLYLERRKFIKTGVFAGLLPPFSLLPTLAAAIDLAGRIRNAKNTVKLDEPTTPEKDATSYNNFYELGTDKGDPVRNAAALSTDPWSVNVSGECNKPGNYPLETILQTQDLEERIYRLRCVEAWSMVIPWIGFPLADLIKRLEPNQDAKYVAFETVYDPENPLPGQRRAILDWPYREGLRMDEAMHPLTLLAVGMYGKMMPNQNGAPLRLVVPWKYGFKSIKSIVSIRFGKTQPETSWNMSAPSEYGFYSNVNPSVSHPRWSQKRERRIGGGFADFFKRETLMFNGYQEQVAHLYKNMDLNKWY